ncbi:MAG: AraC family transcriptional regulator [Arcobacter sp.]|nr:AraC family transcriptional regulator [Arcobacter sp.]
MENLKELKNTIFENVNNSNREFVKHFHDTYTIGITHDGIFNSINSNKSSLSYKNSTRILNPGEVHCGDSTSWKYTNFYPTVELLIQVYEQIYFEKKIPIFEKHIIKDINLYNLLLNFFISTFNKKNKMIIETNLINTISYLIKNYTQTTKKYPNLFDDKIVMKNTIEYINDYIEINISLDELASLSNLSKYHFLRVFKKNIGLTPHQYIINQRIQKAKKLVLSGDKLSNIAYSVGFNDQSHFIRNFKRIYGYSPKKLLDKSNFILY